MWIAVRQQATTQQQELLLFDTEARVFYLAKLNTKTRKLTLDIEKLESLGRGVGFPLGGQAALDFLQQLQRGLLRERESLAVENLRGFLGNVKEFFEQVFQEEA